MQNRPLKNPADLEEEKQADTGTAVNINDDGAIEAEQDQDSLLHYQNIIHPPVINSNPFDPPLASNQQQPQVIPSVIPPNPFDPTPAESVVAQSSLIENDNEHWNTTTPNFKPMDDANNEDEFTLGND